MLDTVLMKEIMSNLVRAIYYEVYFFFRFEYYFIGVCGVKIIQKIISLAF